MNIVKLIVFLVLVIACLVAIIMVARSDRETTIYNKDRTKATKTNRKRIRNNILMVCLVIMVVIGVLNLLNIIIEPYLF